MLKNSFDNFPSKNRSNQGTHTLDGLELVKTKQKLSIIKYVHYWGIILVILWDTTTKLYKE